MKFAKQKIKKELDVARFINQQRETYMAYLTSMTPFQQSVCQKIAQITYNESMSSSSSSGSDDNTNFVWNGVDETNLALLFWDDKEPTSKRLVDLLRIQAETERLSKRRKRRRRNLIKESQNTEPAEMVFSRGRGEGEDGVDDRYDLGDPFEVTLSE